MEFADKVAAATENLETGDLKERILALEKLNNLFSTKFGAFDLDEQISALVIALQQSLFEFEDSKEHYLAFMLLAHMAVYMGPAFASYWDMILSTLLPDLFHCFEDQRIRMVAIGLVTAFSVQRKSTIKTTINRLLSLALMPSQDEALVFAAARAVGIILFTFPAMVKYEESFEKMERVLTFCIDSDEHDGFETAIMLFEAMHEALLYCERSKIETAAQESAFTSRYRDTIFDLSKDKSLLPEIELLQAAMRGKDPILKLNVNNQTVQVSGFPRKYLLQELQRLNPTHFETQMIKNPYFQDFFDIDVMSSNEVKQMRQKYRFEIVQDRKKSKKERIQERETNRAKKEQSIE